jgi:DNA-binding response OmpR family regulator
VEREALDAGCDGFEGKPFEIRAFAARIAGMLEAGAPAVD